MRKTTSERIHILLAPEPLDCPTGKRNHDRKSEEVARRHPLDRAERRLKSFDNVSIATFTIVVSRIDMMAPRITTRDRLTSSGSSGSPCLDPNLERALACAGPFDPSDWGPQGRQWILPGSRRLVKCPTRTFRPARNNGRNNSAAHLGDIPLISTKRRMLGT